MYIKKQNLNDAHKYADMLLVLNESNEEYIKLLISILNIKKSSAANYLEKILEKKPLSFKLIEIYIEILKANGG